MVYLLLMSVALVVLVGRVYVPWAERPRGCLVRRRRLPLLARVRLHAAPAAGVLAATGAGWASGELHDTVVLLATLAVAAAIAVPVRYTLTADGIAVGRAGYRRWTEFGGVVRRSGAARLQGVAGRRGMTVWFAGARDGDEVVALVRWLVQGAYTGRLGPDVAGGAGERAESAPAAGTLRPVS